MILDQLIQYSEDILDNKINACIKHKWACERFLNDLNRVNFDYVFNEEKAERFFEFMRLFKHRKGALAGQFIEPHIIQKFLMGNIYGWEHKETGLRRFKKAYWQVGRKNAKTQTLAITGLYELAARNINSAEIYTAATKKEQAKICWDEANVILKNSAIAEKFKTAYSRITHLKSDSIFRALSKDDKISGDGLNPSMGIIDEYHAHQTTEFYDVLASGMAARPEWLMFIITTAGFELNHPCYRVEYNYLSKILDPNIQLENDEYMILINELEKDEEGNLIDDIEDEKNWIKANPIVCDPFNQIGFAYIRSRVKEAKQENEKLRDVLTKNFNVWMNLGEAKYMNMDKWKRAGRKTCPDMRDCEIILGLDLSATIDLTSLAGTYLKGDKICVWSHSFMPEATFFERCNSDRVPYKLWKDKGLLTITAGAEVDYRFLIKYIKEELENKRNLVIDEICYDKWNATQVATELSDDGYNMIEIRQGIQTLSEPTKKFRALTYDDKIYYKNNELLNWAISNAVVRMDSNENIMLDKAKSVERIDPIAALLNSFVRAVINIDGSCYDDRPEGEKLFSF